MFDPKLKLTIFNTDLHNAAFGKFSEQKLFGQRFLDLFLNDSRQRPRTHFVVIALVAKPFSGRPG